MNGRFDTTTPALFVLADRISVLIYGRIRAGGLPDEVRGGRRLIAAALGDEIE